MDTTDVERGSDLFSDYNSGTSGSEMSAPLILFNRCVQCHHLQQKMNSLIPSPTQRIQQIEGKDDTPNSLHKTEERKGSSRHPHLNKGQ